MTQNFIYLALQLGLYCTTMDISECFPREDKYFYSQEATKDILSFPCGLSKGKGEFLV
jgi:hypothetical protein